MSDLLYKLNLSAEFVTDMERLFAHDKAAFVGLKLVLEELQGAEPVIRQMQEQTVGEAKIGIGNITYCYVNVFIFNGRVVWRIKPRLDPVKGQGFLSANDYRIFFAPNPSKQELLFLAVVKRERVKGDIYVEGHPEHQRICDAYDRNGIGVRTAI